MKAIWTHKATAHPSRVGERPRRGLSLCLRDRSKPQKPWGRTKTDVDNQKGGGSDMKVNNCRQHHIHLGRLLRQTVATVLALTMCLGLAVPAFADNAVSPSAAPPKYSTEMPQITLQINGVIDEITGKFAEYVELSVKVKSGVKYFDNSHAEINKTTYDANQATSTAEIQKFRYVALALEYNAKVLTPVAWNAATGEPQVADPDLTGTTADSFKTQVTFPTLKGKANTAAMAHVSGPTASDVAASTTNDSTGLVYFVAETDSPVELKDETTLAVVRFKYDPSAYAKANFLSGKTMLLGDADQWSALGTAQATTPKTADVSAWQTAADNEWLIRIAPDAKAGGTTGVPTGYQLLYRSKTNIFYYSTEVDPSTKAINSGKKCLILYAADDDNHTDPTSQLLKFGAGENVQFVYTNTTTFDAGGGLDYSKLTACVIVDADNTILGTVIVPKNADVRQMINDYARDNFVYSYDDGVNPADSLRTLTPAQVKSLDRVDTYRGKYPASTPMQDGQTDAYVVKDAKGNYIGESYPLTNKLDYVFFKRPMGHTATKPDPTALDGENGPLYLEKLEEWERTEWKQKEDPNAAGQPYYNTDYPYAYGWALCTQENYQDTWTWLGSNGELAGYAKDGSGFATVTYQNGEDNVLFRFADLENGFTTGQDTVFLKAIYEPGTELMRGKYRMIIKPYLSKLNASAAEAGGSYGAEFTLERSTTDGVDGYVRGATIIREPVVKQAVTFDNLWEENSDLGVNHNLPSATLSETENFEKSAYIQVEVANVEQIIVNLTFSARMNKIEYELMDKYGKNFIGADSRGYDNLSYMTANDDKGNWIADNYNYYVDSESYDTDAWYDAPYKYREGSYGFVLFGTLNSIMQYATIHNANPSENDFNRNVTANVLNNINISMDGNPVDLGTLGTIRERILDAAAQAEDEYTNNHNADWWDEEHSCAQLTYHQLQNYILTWNASTHTGTLLPDATEANQIAALTWCHLHAACASNLGDLPTTWEDMIKTARGADGKDPSALGSMKTAEIEALSHLRSDANGAALTPAQFQTKLVQAVADLDAIAGNNTTIWSWDLVQDRMIRGAGYDASGVYSQEHYWWYDGATAMNFATLAETVSAAKDAIEAPLMPDGSQTATRMAKINRLEPIFDANAAATDVTTAWRNATKNLAITVSGVEGEKFATFHDTVNDPDNFLDHLLNALTDAKTANGGTIPTLAANASDSDVREYWNRLQYHILNNSYPTSHQTEMDNYWWYDGHVQIVDLPTLYRAAQLAVSDPTALDELTLSLLYSTTNTSFHFRSGFNGTTDVYTSANLGDLKTKITTFYGLTGITIPTASSTPGQLTTAWNQLQYYLIHGQRGTNSSIGEESPYYWWRGGDNGSASATDFSGVNNWSTGRDAVLEAAFKSEINGNPHAWDGLTDTIIDNARLVEGENSATTWAGLTHFSGTTSFLSKIDGLSAAAGSQKPGPTQAIVVADENSATWQQIQYYLLNSKTFTDATTADNANYWWRASNTSVVKTPLERFNGIDGIIAAIQEYWDNGNDAALDAWLTDAENLNAVFYNSGSADGSYTESDAGGFAGFAWVFNNFISSGDFSSAAEISWYHIEYALNTFSYSWMDAASTAADMATWSPPITAPAWLVSAGLASVGEPTPLYLTSAARAAALNLFGDTLAARMTTLATDPEALASLSDEEKADLLAATQALLAALQPEPENNAEETNPGDAVTPSDSTSAGGDYTLEPDTVIVEFASDEDDDTAENASVGADLPGGPSDQTDGTNETADPVEETPQTVDPPGDNDPPETDSTIQTVDTAETQAEEGEETVIPSAPETSATARLQYWSPPDPGGTVYTVVYRPIVSTFREEVLT